MAHSDDEGGHLSDHHQGAQDLQPWPGGADGAPEPGAFRQNEGEDEEDPEPDRQDLRDGQRRGQMLGDG